MHIDDEVYGGFEAGELLLLELIASGPIQRLKRIHLSGATYLVRPQRDVTRYEHVVGTMLFIRRLGGSLEEQAAGLLHDVGHTAFSHVVDWALDKEAGDYHERFQEGIIAGPEISAILRRHAADPAAILDETRWRILEQRAPDLCADRIDYALRDQVRVGAVSRQDVEAFMAGLALWDGKLVCRTPEAAEWFVRTYVAEVDGLFMHPLECYAYVVLGCALRLALQEGVLAPEDLHRDDDAVLARLQAAAATQPELARLLAGLHPHVRVEESEQGAHLRMIHKPRVVDPLVWPGDTCAPERLSCLRSRIAALNEWVAAKARRGVGVRVLEGVVP